MRAHQAIGMITAKLYCDVMTAARRLADYARATDQTLSEAAGDVLERRHHFV
jgi:hypothetical protein